MADRLDPEGWTTVLFVPADRPEMLAKAQGRGADAILVDLEDAIAPDRKAAARSSLRAHLMEGLLAGPSAVCVRVNAVGDGMETDLEALAGLVVEAVVLPKAASSDDVELARRVLDERVAGARLIPQVESARGVVALGEVARAGGIAAIAFGGEDFCVDLGVARTPESLELLIPRALVALHARAAGLAAIDTVYTAIGDDEGLVREAEIACALGFSGKLLIHPGQIEPVRRVFAPSTEQFEWARRVVDAQGESGASVRVVDGTMIDAPVLAQARRIIARSR